MVYTSEDVDVVSNAAHRVPLDPAIGQLKLAGYCLPFEVSGGELLADLLLRHWRPSLRHANAILLLHLVGDDDVVETVEAVGDGRIFFIDQPLLFSSKPKLILLVRFDLDICHAI